MNTRMSTRGNKNSVGNSRGSSAPSNNISVDLQDSVKGARRKVVHSPLANQGLSFPLPDKSVESTEFRRLSSEAQIFVPQAGRVSVSGFNPVENIQGESSVNQDNNAAITLNSSVMNIDAAASFNSLIAFVEQSMRATREEFARELSSIRDSISKIGDTTNSHGQQGMPSSFENSNVPERDNINGSNDSGNAYRNFNENVKIEKWKVCFDGLGSVSDFLFKVDTLRCRNRCSDEHLLSNFHVLLDGKAESWYWLYMRQNRHVTYPMLQYALTREFGHLETDHDILLKMSLRSPLPDATLIDILKKNLNPNLQFLLFGAESRDINEFRDMARKAERVIRDTKFQNPIISRNVSEIDLPAGGMDDLEFSDPQIEAINIAQKGPRYDYSGIQCWNCSSYGHSYVYCPEEVRKPFCFKCGAKGVLTPKCPKDHSYQGNRKMGDMATGDNRPSRPTPKMN